jgi:DNA-binding Xre family transcriptional regulator
LRLGISRVIISSRNLQIDTFPEKGGSFMAISYKKLWKLLIDKDMKKKDLQQLAGISAASVTKLGKNENVNTEIIEKICTALRCDVCDIMEMVEEQ